MFLFNTVSAEVEPVPGKKGWFQLTGRKIERWTDDVDDIFDNPPGEIVADPKILGIHNTDSQIAERDPRFNHENDPEAGETSFGVLKNEDGTYTMYLLVNQAEYVLLRFLCPHESPEFGDQMDPIENYRIEKPAKAPAKKAKTASQVKAAPAKKKTKARATA